MQTTWVHVEKPMWPIWGCFNLIFDWQLIEPVKPSLPWNCLCLANISHLRKGGAIRHFYCKLFLVGLISSRLLTHPGSLRRWGRSQREGEKRHSYSISLEFGFVHCCYHLPHHWMAWFLLCNLRQKAEKAPPMFGLFQWQKCCFVCSICTRPAKTGGTGVTAVLTKAPKTEHRWFSPLGTSAMPGHWGCQAAHMHMEGSFIDRNVSAATISLWEKFEGPCSMGRGGRSLPMCCVALQNLWKAQWKLLEMGSLFEGV